MHYPRFSREIGKILLCFIIYLGFIIAFALAIYTMFVTNWYYWRELILSLLLFIIANIVLYKVLRTFIESVLLLFEGIDVYMKAKLEDYFEARDYYIIKHGEYQAGIYFQKRPDGPIRLWELEFEKRILEVNSNFDNSRIRETATIE